MPFVKNCIYYEALSIHFTKLLVEKVKLNSITLVIEYLVNPDNMLREMYRVLKPRGLFVLSTPNSVSWLNRVILLLGYQPTYSEVSDEILIGHICRGGRPSGHLRMFTLRALKGLLQHHGFNIVKVMGSESRISQQL